MGLFSGISNIVSNVGGFLNDITGATSAAKKSQQYALQSAAINNQYQKEFAQNAHQWEVKDLQSAGLNPILSAGGSGTSASGGGVNSAQMASSNLNPIDLASGIINTGINTINGIQTAKRTASESANINADTQLKKIQTLISGIEFDIKTGTSKTEIDRKKAELDKLIEEIEKTKNESFMNSPLGALIKKGIEIFPYGKFLKPFGKAFGKAFGKKFIKK